MTDERDIATTINTLSLREKSMLCSGEDVWTTKPLNPHNIPSLRMADGPHGVRYEDHIAVRENGGHSKPATCFPPQVTLACSFSPELARQMGEALAEECLHFGIGMLLGPGVNIKRSPLSGRNFEYYSEDPLLSGELAAGFINGLQSKDVAASLKHFAANNQETVRMSVSSIVDDRALFDLYLKAFEIAVKKSSPATVMASYNRIHGIFACENRFLLNDTLRLKFGFKGAIISDWGAVNNRVEGVKAGLDLEMPATGGMNDWAIEQAVKTGALNENDLDTACWNNIRLAQKYSRQGKPRPKSDFAAHHQLAVDVLCKSAVLMKNDGILPLKKDTSISVIGEMAKKPRYQGGGSSIVTPFNLVGFTKALEKQNKNYIYAPGYEGMNTSAELLEKASVAASSSEMVILFLGLPDVMECEGYDMEGMSLPEAQLLLLEKIAKVNDNICVVLCCGTPVEMPWLDKVKAVLCPMLGGEGIGEALFKLLYGQEVPSGKLAETWPHKLTDTPTYHHFPMGPEEVTYNESIFCGYRYYDTAGKDVLFPFGYGLSYTTFEYSALAVSCQNEDGSKSSGVSQNTALKKGQSLMVTFRLENTGIYCAEEIVQMYLSRCTSAAMQPKQELCAFDRVRLEAGQAKEITLSLSYSDLAFYDVNSSSSVVEQGEYAISVGSSSRSLPLSHSFKAEGTVITPKEQDKDTLDFYKNIKDNVFPEDKFLSLYGRPIKGNKPVKQGAYTKITTLGEMHGSRWGRMLLGLATFVAERAVHFSNDHVASKHASRQLARDMPFKNLSMNTSGIISPVAEDILLDLCNGKGGVVKLIGQLIKTPPYRTRAYKKSVQRYKGVK